MYAIIEDSGQQFKVSEGEVLRVDVRDLAEGAKEIEFGRVLLLAEEGNVRVGRPLVEGAKVQAEILDPLAKGEKVYVYYFRRRKHSRSKVGHRQKYLEVRVTKIVAAA
jgi:large subunit ribosomal protein L21